MIKLATKNVKKISKLRPPMVGRRKGSEDHGSPLRKGSLANLARAETHSSSSLYEDDFETYAVEMDEDDDDNKELDMYKTYLNEDAEFVKGIISSAGGDENPLEGEFEEYERSLQFIEDGLQRSQQLTDGMVSILDSFSTRLTTLEATMIPIHRLMQQWKFAHENINKAMGSVSKVIDIFDTASRVEGKINDGARGEYDSYLACIDSMGEAVIYLTNNKNFKSAEKALAQLKTLLKQGLTELENIFRSLIMKHSNPIDPLKLPEKPPERRHLELVPQNAIEELKKVVKRFSVFNYTNHLKDYKDKRGKFLVNTMRRLNPDKFVKDTTEGKVGYAKGSHKFIEFLRTTLRLFQAERDLGLELLDAANFDSVFSDVLEQPIELLEETTDAVIKSKKNTESMFGVFVLFDIWENFNNMLPEFEREVKVRNGKQNEAISEMVGKLKQVCQKSFNDFEEEVKKDNLKMLPVDGTVHELTSNTVNYLKRLFEYKETVEALLPRPTNPKQTSLGEFIINVLTLLRNNLESKAKREKKASLANIFLLNNYHYMLKTIRMSEIISVISGANVFLREYEKLFDEQMDIYISSWNKANDLVSITVDDKRIQGRPPSHREKKFIKKKLHDFNSEIEEQFHTQKAFSVPDTDLQNKLRQDAIAKLVPTYTKFYAMYADVPFSKNKGKYLRYGTETLTDMLNGFFVGQADPKKAKFKF